VGKRNWGGKRKAQEVRCRDCSRNFEWWSSGTSWEIFVTEPKPKEFVKLKFVGKKKEYFAHLTYKLSDFRCLCGGRLDRLSIPNPMRKVIVSEKGYELLECGHQQWPRSDIFGSTNAMKRQCRECGKALRAEALKKGNTSVDVTEFTK
jgi:hypothetical protein